VGESAAMPDPLTGNGVTSGIRHARYAAQAITLASDAPSLPAAIRRTYTRHVQRLGHAFNAHIEHAVYQHPLRQGMSIPTATLVYTLFGFFMNALYTRFDPQGPVGMAAFDVLFGTARLWVALWLAAARASFWLRGSSADVGAV
jgi:hypothetical protein